MLAWGLCCTLMGLVHNYDGLLAARAFLGIAEGGLFPGIVDPMNQCLQSGILFNKKE